MYLRSIDNGGNVLLLITHAPSYHHIPLTQISTMAAQLHDLVIARANQCAKEFADDCTESRITTIVKQNETISKTGPLMQCKGEPYASFVKPRSKKFLQYLKKPMHACDVIPRLVCDPILHPMIPALQATLSEGINNFINKQQAELTQFFKDCERTTAQCSTNSSSSSSSGDGDAQSPRVQARVLAQQRLWATLQQFIQTALSQFKRAAQLSLREYIKDCLKPFGTGLILDELKEMRPKALRIKSSPKKGMPVNEARVAVFKHGLKSLVRNVLRVLIQHYTQFCSERVEGKLIATINGALKSFKNWLIEQQSTHTAVLEERYTEASKQLKQLVALDSVQTRSAFKYATVDKAPLLIDKLRAVYRDDDAEYLTAVLNGTVSESDSDDVHDDDDDDSDGTATAAAAAAGGDSSNSNSSNSNSSSNSSRPTLLKCKYAAVGGSSSNGDNNHTDE
eukprot:16684-Heterococcus_DN1.PRE.2